MFSKAEIKAFILKYGERWFFPDFTNKLTWYVVTLGAGLVIVPQPVKILAINWAIHLFNTNADLGVALPDMEAYDDYMTGLFLIFMALVHNIGYKYFELKKSIFSHRVRQDKRIFDTNLLNEFLADFSSESPSLMLLKEHDFGFSFDRRALAGLELFHYRWNGAEYHFIDSEIEGKRSSLHKKCSQFLSKIGEYTIPIGDGDYSSVTPERYRGGGFNLPENVQNQIDELNFLATELHQQHQEFISFSRAKIQS